MRVCRLIKMFKIRNSSTVKTYKLKSSAFVGMSIRIS